MASDNQRDNEFLRAFASRSQQSKGRLTGPVHPGAQNPGVFGSVFGPSYVDSTQADNKIRTISNQRKTNMATVSESFNQQGGPRW